MRRTAPSACNWRCLQVRRERSSTAGDRHPILAPAHRRGRSTHFRAWCDCYTLTGSHPPRCSTWPANGLWFDSFLIPLYTLALLLSGLWALRATQGPAPCRRRQLAPSGFRLSGPLAVPAVLHRRGGAHRLLRSGRELADRHRAGRRRLDAAPPVVQCAPAVVPELGAHVRGDAGARVCDDQVRALRRGLPVRGGLCRRGVADPQATRRVERSRYARHPAGTGQPTSDAKELPVPSGPGCFKDLLRDRDESHFPGKRWRGAHGRHADRPDTGFERRAVGQLSIQRADRPRVLRRRHSIGDVQPRRAAGAGAAEGSCRSSTTCRPCREADTSPVSGRPG